MQDTLTSQSHSPNGHRRIDTLRFFFFARALPQQEILAVVISSFQGHNFFGERDYSSLFWNLLCETICEILLTDSFFSTLKFSIGLMISNG